MPERLLNDWIVGFLRWQRVAGLLIESSPNAFSDYWQGRLKKALEDNVPFGEINGELVNPSSPKLFIGAVDVLTGEFKIFGSHRRSRGRLEDASGEKGYTDPASPWIFIYPQSKQSHCRTISCVFGIAAGATRCGEPITP